MSMSDSYGPGKPEADMIKLIHHAINSGVTFLDTSDLYGPHTNEILIGKVFLLLLFFPNIYVAYGVNSVILLVSFQEVFLLAVTC